MRNVDLRPIRILFVHDHLGLASGVTHGAATYLHTLLPSFDRTRVQAMLCLCRPRHPAAERFEVLGINPIFLSRGKWDPRVVLDLMRVVRQHDIDILHLSGHKSHFFGRLAAIAMGRKAVIHLHMTYTPRPRFVHRILASYTSAALAVSEPLRRLAIEKFAIPEKMAETLHNPIDIGAIRKHAPDARDRIRRQLQVGTSAPVILMFGRITSTPNKGHAELIRAMPKVLDSCEHAVLLVVGDGPARPACEALVKKLGLGERVIFTGYRTDIPDILAAVDVVAMPSMWEEPFGYAALEASAVGRPVVGFRVGGIPEVILHDQTGILVSKGDVAGLAAGLVRILTDSERAREMGDASRRHAESFNLAHHRERLEEIYGAIAPRHPKQDGAA